MKTAIMQPYFFPYIGYYQLINAVDTFVLLDDVNFIVRGWINRNNILINGKPYLFTIPLNKSSRNKLICDTQLNFSDIEKQNFLKTVKMAYQKAPYFHDFYSILEEIILYPQIDLTDFLVNSFIKTSQYLGIKTTFMRSSQIEKDPLLKAEDRIIEICKKVNTDIYINLPGGLSLYHEDKFKKENMKLYFINTLFDKIVYSQFRYDFVSHLSFLDMLMFNSKQEIINFLNQYTLIKAEQ